MLWKLHDVLLHPATIISDKQQNPWDFRVGCYPSYQLYALCWNLLFAQPEIELLLHLHLQIEYLFVKFVASMFLLKCVIIFTPRFELLDWTWCKATGKAFWRTSTFWLVPFLQKHCWLSSLFVFKSPNCMFSFLELGNAMFLLNCVLIFASRSSFFSVRTCQIF